MLRAAGFLLTLAVVLLGAETAPGATLKIGNDGILWYHAEPGETNHVSFQRGESPYWTGVLVRHSGAPLTISYGCHAVPEGALCDGIPAGDEPIDARLGDGDDGASISGDGPSYGAIYGGSGNDTISGGGQNRGGIYTLDGGGGADTIGAGDGQFTITGGSGADNILIIEPHSFGGSTTTDAGDGDDVVRTDDYITGAVQLGPGRDVLETPKALNAGSPQSWDGGPGYDVLRYTDDGTVALGLCSPSCHFEELDATSPNGATLIGTDDAEVINGGPGPDTLIPMGGADTVNGNGGDDSISAEQDGAVDRITCGSGLDNVTRDVFDWIASDCETASL